MLLASAFRTCFEIMQLPITVEGFTFTLWQLFVFLTILYLVVRLVFGIFK